MRSAEVTDIALEVFAVVRFDIRASEAVLRLGALPIAKLTTN